MSGRWDLGVAAGMSHLLTEADAGNGWERIYATLVMIKI
jgi:hypothetical protein